MMLVIALDDVPYGPSPKVARAVQLELGRLSRYADEPLARQLAEQIAEQMRYTRTTW
jgi:histidinol-phosphate/aromatic aminotransferase/cobyric acid decarboxylase-like protein